MFDWDCGFLDDSDLSMNVRQLARSSVPILAIENTCDAEELFKYRPPPGRLAVIVGNERKGISRSVLRLADRVLRIPVASAHINTVNVAAAAAIAVFHLSRAREGRIGANGGGGRGRPEVLLTGVTDAIELGSAVRSAACFGWRRLFIDDLRATWFATDRVTRSLGRGAARRARNPIRVLPVREDGSFDEVCIVGACGGEPLRRADLGRGPRQLVVIPDENDGFDEDSAARLGRNVRRVCLETEPGAARPFRLIASIVLAEIARQVGGWRTVASGRP
jgi:hypothetical protein